MLQTKQLGGESWVRENIIFLIKFYICDWSIVKAILALPHALYLPFYSGFQIESKQHFTQD